VAAVVQERHRAHGSQEELHLAHGLGVRTHIVPHGQERGGQAAAARPQLRTAHPTHLQQRGLRGVQRVCVTAAV